MRLINSYEAFYTTTTSQIGAKNGKDIQEIYSVAMATSLFTKAMNIFDKDQLIRYMIW